MTSLLTNKPTSFSSQNSPKNTPVFQSNSSGKEKDTETGYHYFGARYYNPDLSLWLSVDPMADKYPSLSPYNYCAWNPMKLVDPNGNEIWKPDPDGNLIAERGDNVYSLSKFLNISVEEAGEMLNGQGLSSSDEIAEGSKLSLDNVYTRSIQAAKDGKIRSMTKQQIQNEFMSLKGNQKVNWRKKWFEKKDDIYNCWGSAITGSQGNEIVGGCGISTANQYSQCLQNDYISVNETDAVFGQTVISFSNNGNVTHGAVYYGTDNTGVIYVYTKNGWIYPPTISRLGDLPVTYGTISGYHNPK